MANGKISSDVNTKYITTGSIKDIQATGIYYLAGGVTDKPDNNGGTYICVFDSVGNGSGLYIPLYGNNNQIAYITRRYADGTFFGTKPQQLRKSTLNATTTASGAVAFPNIDGEIISVHYADSHVGNVYMRDISYFTCLKADNTPLSNENVTLSYVYYDGDE